MYEKIYNTSNSDIYLELSQFINNYLNDNYRLNSGDFSSIINDNNSLKVNERQRINDAMRAKLKEIIDIESKKNEMLEQEMKNGNFSNVPTKEKYDKLIDNYKKELLSVIKNKKNLYVDINDKINQLQSTNKYSQEQLEAIKYACYRPEINEDLLLDPSISADDMMTYIFLATNQKINVERYVREGWHNKGYSTDALYEIIKADANNIDISDITPDMSIDEVRDAIKSSIDAKEVSELLKNSLMTNNEKMKLINLDPSNEVTKYILKQSQNYDISPLLRDNLKEFNLEQIKYLNSIISTGESIDKIFDPNLSVEDMKKIMLKSDASKELYQDVMLDIEKNERVDSIFHKF